MKINISLIGYGYWGQKLYKYLNEKFIIRHVCDLNVKKEGIFTKNIEWDDVSAVVIATPIETHYKIVKEALLAGKNVLCEKPLTTNSKEVLELKKLAQRKKLILQTEFTYTFSKALKKAKEIDIGKIEAIEMTLGYAGKFSKYNVYWVLGPHLLSILDMFISLDKLKFKKIDFIKNEMGIILFDGKIKGSLTVSLNYPEKRMKVILYGEKGTIVYSSMEEPSLRVIHYRKDRGIIGDKDKLITKIRKYHINEKDNLRLAVEHFHKVLKNKEKSNINRALLITNILEKQNE